MPIELNHTIVQARDQDVAARWLTDLLGLEPPTHLGPFTVVELDNGVSLDFLSSDGDIEPVHYCFLVSEEEFDPIFARLQAAGTRYWADPMLSREGQINTHDGGRGVYFRNADGHILEAITRPYGSGA